MQSFLTPPLTTSRSKQDSRYTPVRFGRPVSPRPTCRPDAVAIDVARASSARLTASRPTPKRRRPPSESNRNPQHIPLTPFDHTGIIHGYAKEGKLPQMRAAVHAALKEGFVLNAVNFTTIANAYAISATPQMALSTLDRMREQDIQPTNVTLRVAAKACERIPGSGKALMEILEWMTQNGEAGEVLSWNLALRTLGRLGEADKMCELIKAMNKDGPQPDVWSYNSVLHALGVEKRLIEAFELWGDMIMQGIKPDVVTYNTILEMGVGVRKWPFGDVETGPARFVAAILKSMQRHRVAPNLMTETLLLRLLCRKQIDAVDEGFVRERMFIVLNGEKSPDKMYFDALLTAFAHTRNMSAVADVFHLMQARNVRPDIYTVRAILHAASLSGDVALATRILDILEDNSQPLDNILYTSAISACARHSPPDSETAVSLLESARSSNVTWTPPMLNAVLASYGNNCTAAVDYWKGLQQTAHLPSRRAVFHRVTFDAVFRVCGRAGRPDLALRIFYAAKQAGNILSNSAASRSMFSAFQKGVTENGLTLGGPYMRILKAECGVREGTFSVERIRIKF